MRATVHLRFTNSLTLIIKTKMDHISIEDFAKVEMKVGEILSVEKVPDTDRLLRLSVNLGEEEPRQIVSGIAEYFPNEQDLVGKQVVFASNLAPRTIKGLVSNGMILAMNSPDGLFALMTPSQSVTPGTKIK